MLYRFLGPGRVHFPGIAVVRAGDRIALSAEQLAWMAPDTRALFVAEPVEEPVEEPVAAPKKRGRPRKRAK